MIISSNFRFYSSVERRSTQASDLNGVVISGGLLLGEMDFLDVRKGTSAARAEQTYANHVTAAEHSLVVSAQASVEFFPVR